MKQILSFLLLLSALVTACSVSPAPAVEATLAPYAPDTPSPAQIDAPLVEAPALTSIQFFNALDGWGVSVTQILRTNDGGITWYNVSPPDVVSAGYQASLALVDNAHAWVLLPVSETDPTRGTLYRTSDGGLSWNAFPAPFAGADLHFLDFKHGWALSSLGVATGSNTVAIFQTADGGQTWSKVYTNLPSAEGAGDSLPLGGLKAGMAPLNTQTAFVYGVIYATATPYLFRTDDGGVTWSAVSLPLPPAAENAELSIERGQMKFLSPSEGFIAMRLTSANDQLALYVTQDGGNSWTLTPNVLPGSGVADFLSAQEAVVFSSDQFYVTRDAARTWNIVLPDLKFGEVFAGMDFSDTLHGWVLTMDPSGRRTLYRSHDGGATWFPIVP